MQPDRILWQSVQTIKTGDLTAEDSADDAVGIFDRQSDIDLFFTSDGSFTDR